MNNALMPLRRYCGIAAFLLMASLLTVTRPAHAEPLTWVTRLGFPQSLPVVGEAARSLADRLAAMSGGGMTLDLRPPADGLAAADIPAAVAEGRAPAGLTWIGRTPGNINATHLFDAVPFGPEPALFMAWYYEDRGHDMLQETFANQGMDLHALLCGLAGPESAGWFTEPVESIDDLDGMKGRFGGLGGEILKRLGVQISDVQPTRIRDAVEAGELQATEMALPAIDVHTGIEATLPYNLYPGWQQPFTAVYLLVNGNRWRDIGPDRQALVRSACEAVTARTLARSMATRGPTITALRENGARLRRLPAPVLTALREATQTVLRSHAERNPQFSRVLESQRTFVRDHEAASSPSQ